MIAKQHRLEKFVSNRRGRDHDNRKRGACAIFSYFTRGGVEYRRALWLPIGSNENDALRKAPPFIVVQ